MQCTNCQLIFYKEELNDEEIKRIYKELYHSGNDSSYQAHMHQLHLMQQGIQLAIGHNKKKVISKIDSSRALNIGEIGAGVGIIGNYFAKRNVNYTGIELDEIIAARARACGINIQTGSFKNLQLYVNSFDAVLAFEVIEHIDDLKSCLELIRHALRDKGRFGFTVPNFDKRKNYNSNPEKLYQPNPPVHVNFFTIENLRKILELSGFRIEYLKTRFWPDLNFKSTKTYVHLLKALFGKFEGSTIMCVAVKT